MAAITFQSLLLDPEHLKPEAAVELQKVIVQYPYCQMAHFLLAKLQYPEEGAALEKAAVYAPNRRHLQLLLTGKLTLNDKTAPSLKSKAPTSGHDILAALASLEETPLTPSSLSERSLEQRKLIDHFLESKPLPGRDSENNNTKNYETEGDLSKESTKLNPNIASEPLAKLLVQQGKKEQAIEIFLQLQLKFPEKSAYFASEIANLKKL